MHPDLIKALLALRSNSGAVPFNLAAELGLPFDDATIPSDTEQSAVRIGAPNLPAGLFDYMSQFAIQVTSGSVNGLVEVKGADDVTVAGAGSLLAELDLAFARAATVIRRIGGWLPASDEVIADDSSMSALSARLLYHFRYAVDNQLLNGENKETSLAGIRTAANVPKIASRATSNADHMPRNPFNDIVSAGQSVVDAGLAMPSALAIKPSVLFDLYQSSANDADAFFRGLGITVIPAPSLPFTAAAGGDWAVMGDFAQNAQLYMRREGTVETGYAGDNFVKAMQSARIYGRLGVAWLRPTAFAIINVA